MDDEKSVDLEARIDVIEAILRRMLMGYFQAQHDPVRAMEAFLDQIAADSGGPEGGATRRIVREQREVFRLLLSVADLGNPKRQ